jgi:hypothetical protein
MVGVRYLDGENEAVGGHLQLALSTIGQRVMRDDDHVLLRQHTLARHQSPLLLLAVQAIALARTRVFPRGRRSSWLPASVS